MVVDKSKSSEDKHDHISDDLNTLYKPLAVTEIVSSTRLVLEIEKMQKNEEGSQSIHLVEISAILHGKIERTRYVAHAARYVYKVWVVADNGGAITVDEISATMQSGNGSFHKRIINASSLTKQEDICENGKAFSTASLVATAKKGNASATVEVKFG